METRKHFIVYQITNLINGKIYIGAHQTDNLDDGYMGSSEALNFAIDRHGLDNFKKEILFDFSCVEDMYIKEAEIVDDNFVARTDTYNIKRGGDGGWSHTAGTVLVEDTYEDGKIKRVKKDNPEIGTRYIRRHKGKQPVKNKLGETLFMSKEDPRFGKEFFPIAKNMIVVKDKTGKTFNVSRDDPRYLSGELVAFWCGRKHTEAARKKMRDSSAGLQSKEKNSMFNKRWIHHKETGETKLINKQELEKYINEGWEPGKKPKFVSENPNGLTWIWNPDLNISILLGKEIAERKMKEGWLHGRCPKKKNGGPGETSL